MGRAEIILQKANFWKSFYRPCILYSDNRYYCIYGVISQDNEWYLSMSTGDSPDDIHGISVQDVGNSAENMEISAKHSFTQVVKDAYHFVQSLCRPELVLICIIVAAVLMLIKKCSLSVIWGSSWALCVLRFYGQFRWFNLHEKFLLLFTAGIISVLCALAIKEINAYMDSIS